VKRWFVRLTTALVMVLADVAMSQVQETIFNLTPQQKFLSCFAQSGYAPTAQVIVQLGAEATSHSYDSFIHYTWPV